MCTTTSFRTGDYPILEFDPAEVAVIEPHQLISSVAFPERAVACFFQDVIDMLVAERGLKPLTAQRSEMGLHPVYTIRHAGMPLAIFHPCAGAPMAAAMLEEVIAHGARVIVACGGAGVLSADIPVGRLVVPTSAIRDEGTSYHYLPPSREVQPSSRVVQRTIQVLQGRRIPHLMGKAWTTDAVYRETPKRIHSRAQEGALVVDMEAAALFAIGRFRGVDVGEILYAGDSVGGGCWEHRDWNTQKSIRSSLFWLSCEICSQVPLQSPEHVR